MRTKPASIPKSIFKKYSVEVEKYNDRKVWAISVPVETTCILMAPGITTATSEKEHSHTGFSATPPMDARVVQAGIYVQKAKVIYGRRSPLNAFYDYINF